ncbi:MAG: hypothetical protein EA425_03350 [Puniceicoccaceae bacterium]|nr:MAG: hypothetical protein EA425_03350 [Puniceicoccaceae bacterium]
MPRPIRSRRGWGFFKTIQPPKMNSARPNILLIHSDQHRFDCVGANQPFVPEGPGRLVRTPHLDRLAAEGRTYTHAFTPNPVCSPARACLQTGAWSSTHKCITIVGTEAYQPSDPKLPVLTQLLADAGYRVGHVGKFHGEVAGGPTDHGAEVYIGSGDYRKWRADQGLPPRPRTQGYFGEIDPVTPEQTGVAWSAREAEQLLERFAGGEAPFFLRWDPPEPHLPSIVPAELAEWFPPETLPPWPGFDDPLENKPAVQRRARRRGGVGGWTWEEWAPVVGRYLADVVLLDLQVGRLLAALDRLGLAENTLVVYSTDHGDMCGGHGMMDKHYVMYDDIMRVPLLMRWPGVIRAGETDDRFVSHELDLARTFLAVAGVEAPASFVGRDLVAATAGEATEPEREDIFAQYQGTHQGLYSQRMLRDRRWKYVYNPVAFDELYDLEEDPGEIRNRVDDPAAAAELERLRGRMEVWMAEVRDSLSGPLWVWKGK